MESGYPKVCCVCGRSLPNRYAVAGTCLSGDGCEAVFCAMHWHGGNRLCPSHGWTPRPTGLPAADDAHDAVVSPSTSNPNTADSANAMEPNTAIPATVSLTVEQKKTAARAALDAISKLGANVAALVKKLSGVQDPQELIDSFSAGLEANRSRRAPLQERYDALYREISAKKKAWQAAPPARRKIMELELKTLLSEYQGLERQLTAYFENERTLVAVRTRVEEVVALEMRKVSEKTIDGITDNLEDAVADAEGANDAVRDLENAGRRRDRDGDADSFADALAGFDMPEDGAVEPEASTPLVIPPAIAPATREATAQAAETSVPGLADLVP